MTHPHTYKKDTKNIAKETKKTKTKKGGRILTYYNAITIENIHCAVHDVSKSVHHLLDDDVCDN